MEDLRTNIQHTPFATMLAQKRRKYGLTYRELSIGTMIAENDIAAFEQDVKSPTPEEMTRLSRFFLTKSKF